MNDDKDVNVVSQNQSLLEQYKSRIRTIYNNLNYENAQKFLDLETEIKNLSIEDTIQLLNDLGDQNNVQKLTDNPDEKQSVFNNIMIRLFSKLKASIRKDYKVVSEEVQLTLAGQAPASEAQIDDWQQLTVEQMKQKTVAEIYSKGNSIGKKEKIDVMIKDFCGSDIAGVQDAINQMDEQHKFPELKEELVQYLFNQLNKSKKTFSSSEIEEASLKLSRNQLEQWFHGNNEIAGNFNLVKIELDSKIEGPSQIIFYDQLDLLVEDDYLMRVPSNYYTNQICIINPQNKQFVGSAKLVPIKDSADKYRITWEYNDFTERFAQLSNDSFQFLFLQYDAFTDFANRVLNEESGPEFTFGAVEIRISRKQVVEVDTPLCIDFGTSNTTVGCHFSSDDFAYHQLPEDAINARRLILESADHDGINFVQFYDSITEKYNYVVPTVIHVDRIERKNGEAEGDPQLSFGFEAFAKRGGMIFYGLKRWMSDLETSNGERKEQLRDQYGEWQYYSRKQLIKRYIDYVIRVAQNQFKVKFTRLHFSAPVKMKHKFHEQFEKMFGDRYEICDVLETMDEGVSVLYDSIRSNLMSDSNIAGKAFIIDCGGGTTDLTECEYNVSDDFASGGKKLQFLTTYGNGNTNFGGNNLTNRIMQMLKIKFAWSYIPAFREAKEAEGLQPNVESFLKEIDEAIELISNADGLQGVIAIDQLYEKLVNTYGEAEEYIPTKFDLYKMNKTLGDDFSKVRHNFYFLWDTAENIKQQFFEKQSAVSVGEGANGNERIAPSTFIDEKFKFYIKSEMQFHEQKELPSHFTFTVREVQALISPEIYAVEHQFLDHKDIQEFNPKQKIKSGKEQKDLKITIKLTGQSCRIPYFRDMMKEFIPGRWIKGTKAGQSGKFDWDASIELKLACVRGAIKYFRDKRSSEIMPLIEYRSPSIPYHVFCKKVPQVFSKAEDNSAEAFVPDKEKLLLPCIRKDKTPYKVGEAYGMVAVSTETPRLVLAIRNHRAEIGERVVEFQELFRSATEYSKPDILKLLKEKIHVHEKKALDWIESKVIDGNDFKKHYITFASTTDDGWDIQLLLLTYHHDTSAWKVVEITVPFENENAFRNFFDGKH
jgi:hypothetical protein